MYKKIFIEIQPCCNYLNVKQGKQYKKLPLDEEPESLLELLELLDLLGFSPLFSTWAGASDVAI